MNEETRERVEQLQEQISETQERLHNFRMTHNEEDFKNCVLYEVQKTNPRVKSIRTAVKKAQESGIYDSLWETYKNDVRLEYKSIQAIFDGLKEKLHGILVEQEPEPSEDEWYPVTTSWVSTYSTQGFGANSYARGAAETRADECREGSPEIEIRVVYKNEENGLEEYVVEARVASTLEAQIVRLRMKPPRLRDWVKSCWARGVNPRVYQPFLPHGFEEENGLDYFGNDVEKR